VEQVVVREKASKKQAVPMLVGSVFGQVLDLLFSAALIERVTKRAATGTQSIPELALLDAHVSSVVLFVDGQVFQRRAAGRLGRGTGLESDAGELVAEISTEGGHGRKCEKKIRRVTGLLG
jgi:hypothetical protein